MSDEPTEQPDELEPATQAEVTPLGTGTPPTSPHLGLPRYSSADAADFASEVNAIVDALDPPSGTGGVAKRADPPAAHAASHAVGGADPVSIYFAGMMMMFAGSAAPTGWLLCQGQAVARGSYPALFAAIGTTYGAGDGTNTFNLPNMTGCTAIGPDPTGATLPNTKPAAGARFGEEYHASTVNEMPVHSHTINGSSTGVYTGAAYTGMGVASAATGMGFGDPGHGHVISPVNAGAEYSLATDASGNVYAGTGAGTYNTIQTLQNKGYFISLQGAARSTGCYLGDPGHAHSLADPAHTHTIGDPGHAHGAQNAGASWAHNNMQPSVAVNHIIKT